MKNGVDVAYNGRSSASCSTRLFGGYMRRLCGCGCDCNRGWGDADMLCVRVNLFLGWTYTKRVMKRRASRSNFRLLSKA